METAEECFAAAAGLGLAVPKHVQRNRALGAAAAPRSKHTVDTATTVTGRDSGDDGCLSLSIGLNGTQCSGLFVDCVLSRERIVLTYLMYVRTGFCVTFTDWHVHALMVLS